MKIPDTDRRLPGIDIVIPSKTKKSHPCGRFSKEGCTCELNVGIGKRGLLEKGSFQKNPFSRDPREFRDSREPQECGKQKGIRPFSRELEILEILEIPPLERPLSS